MEEKRNSKGSISTANSKGSGSIARTSQGYPQPRGPVTGVIHGVNKMHKEVAPAMGDLIDKPRQGLKEGGAVGAIKGVGQGVRSAVAGGTVGTCELLASTIEGVRATPDTVRDHVRGPQEGAAPILESKLGETEPKHLGQGLVQGTVGMARGIRDGAVSLVKKPVDGARENGVVGLVKGVGKGVRDAGTSTVVGTLDLATSVVVGMKNTPAALDKAKAERRAARDAVASTLKDTAATVAVGVKNTPVAVEKAVATERKAARDAFTDP